MANKYNQGVADGTIKDLRTYIKGFIREISYFRIEGDGTVIVVPMVADTAHWDRQILETKSRFDAVLNMTTEQLENEAELYYQKQLKWKEERTERNVDKIEVRRRYETMIARLKLFALKEEGQELSFYRTLMNNLTEGLKFDCGDKGVDTKSPVKMTGLQWQSDELSELNRCMAIYRENIEFRKKEAETLNKWTQRLADYLNTPDMIHTHMPPSRLNHMIVAKIDDYGPLFPRQKFVVVRGINNTNIFISYHLLHGNETVTYNGGPVPKWDEINVGSILGRKSTDEIISSVPAFPDMDDHGRSSDSVSVRDGSS